MQVHRPLHMQSACPAAMLIGSRVDALLPKVMHAMKVRCIGVVLCCILGAAVPLEGKWGRASLGGRMVSCDEALLRSRITCEECLW